MARHQHLKTVLRSELKAWHSLKCSSCGNIKMTLPSVSAYGEVSGLCGLSYTRTSSCLPIGYMCVFMRFASFKLLSTALAKNIPPGILHIFAEVLGKINMLLSNILGLFTIQETQQEGLDRRRLCQRKLQLWSCHRLPLRKGRKWIPEGRM